MTEITIRNLLFHITPFSNNDVWRRNVSQLLRRIDTFNGKRIVGVAVDQPNIDRLETVKRSFGSHRVDNWITASDCDATWRETPTFYPMMRSVFSIEEHEASWYGHTKGVTHGNNDVITSWRNQMYRNNLDRWQEAMIALRTHSCVGAYRQYDHDLGVFGHIDKSLLKCKWHYSGSFFWFRNDVVFGNAAWDQVPMSGYAVEFYLPMLIAYEDSFCIYRDHPPQPYSNDAHEPLPDPPDWAAQLPGYLRVELGGGINPRIGFLNLDASDKCDLRIDLQEVADGIRPLPLANDSVDELYSSHFLEHIHPKATNGSETSIHRLLWEICRICRIGARVEIRVPHWNQNQAMSGLAGHCHTLSHKDVDHMTKEFPKLHWQDSPKRLRHIGTTYIPGILFDEAKQLLPHWQDDQIMRMIPDTCHECQFVFEVIPNI